MKKLNLGISLENLKLDGDSKNSTGVEISENYITSAFNWLQQEPKNHGDPKSAGLTVSEQRKISKVFTAIDNNKDGIIELEDDIYEFLKSTFNKVKWIGGTKIIVLVADAIDNIIKDEDTFTDTPEAETPGD